MESLKAGRGCGPACWAVLSAAVLVSCADASARAGKAPAAPVARDVDVLTVRPSEVRDTGEYLGSLLSRDSVLVLPQVNGYVRRIHVKPGAKVKAGDPLVEIDARQESAALATAEAQRDAADARVKLARQTLARTSELHDKGVISAHELDRSKAEVQSAEAAARAAEATATQRRVDVQLHTIRSAVPGVVGEVSVRVGDYVSAGTRLTSIAQMDVLELSVAIPSTRARALPPQAPLEVLDRAGNVLAHSTVFYVAPEADPRTQLVDVKGVLQNTSGLRPNEVVRARLVYGTRQALQVPALAVLRQSGQPFVFAVSEKDGATTVERRPITLGPLGEQAYVVEGGLRDGDRIAVSSIQMLRDGAPIRPRESAPRPVDAQDPSAVGAPSSH